MQLSLTTDSPSILTVDQLTGQLKALIEGAFPTVTVEGEIVSCRPSSSGHVYFSLRGEKASLPCVAFRSTAQRLPINLRDGLHIQATGAVELYPPHGRYQLVLRWARPSGEGALLAELEDIKRRLHSEGLFSSERKKELPWLPKRIGIITSPTGAAIRDLIRSIHSRFPVPILLAPCAVQGAHAAPALIEALNKLSAVKDIDVIVIGRGGGSLEDLWAFNDENLARAIAACPTPVISAVGHEIDTPVSDLIADVRAATPTGVGELVVPDAETVADRLNEVCERLRHATVRRQKAYALQHSTLESRLRDPGRLIRDQWRRLDDATHRLEGLASRAVGDVKDKLDRVDARLAVLHPRKRLQLASDEIGPLEQRLTQAIRRQLRQNQTELTHREDRLRSLGPDAVLDRGYAIVKRQAAGKTQVVRSSSEVQLNSVVEVLLSEGALKAEVVEHVENPLRRQQDKMEQERL